MPAGGTVTHSWSITGNGTIVGSNTGSSVSVLAGAAGTYTLTDDIIRDGCPGQCTEEVTVLPNPTCSISNPGPFCPGSTNTHTSTVLPAGGTVTHSWSIIGNGEISGPTTGATVTVIAGAAGTYTVTDNILRDGCPGSCNITVTVQGCGKACTPGFWKTHPEVWDAQNDFVVDNIPGALPSTPGNTFVTTTNFNTYFALTNDNQGFYAHANLTMLGAASLNGNKNCQALVRHGVSALLGAAAFPGEYPFPAGSSDFASLYTLIRNALESGNCDALATILANINNLDGPFCSALSQLEQVAQAESQKIAGFEAYPVPFKDQLTIRYNFNYKSNVKIEVFDASGALVLSKTDANGYLNKEITLNLNSNKGQEQVYIVKLTTDRGSSTKKVMSSR